LSSGPFFVSEESKSSLLNIERSGSHANAHPVINRRGEVEEDNAGV